MVTCLPFAALSPAATATLAELLSSSLELLVQAASAATDRAPPPRRKPRRPREDGVSCGSVMTRSLFERGCAEGRCENGVTGWGRGTGAPDRSASGVWARWRTTSVGHGTGRAPPRR